MYYNLQLIYTRQLSKCSTILLGQKLKDLSGDLVGLYSGPTLIDLRGLKIKKRSFELQHKYSLINKNARKTSTPSGTVFLKKKFVHETWSFYLIKLTF